MANLIGGSLGRKIILLLLLIIIIGGVFWWWSRPELVIKRAINNLQSAEAQQFNAVITLTDAPATSQLLGEPTQLQFQADGIYDKSAAPASISADITITAQAESLTLLITGQVKLIGDKAFLLVTKAPAAFPILAATKGQWIELPRGRKISRNNLTADENLFTGVSRSERIKINDQKFRSYAARVAPPAVLTFIDGLTSDLGLDNAQLNTYRAIISDLEYLPVTLAITPWSNKVRYINTTLDLPDNNLLELTINFNDQNKLVNIDPPSDALTPGSLPERQLSPARENSPIPSPPL